MCLRCALVERSVQARDPLNPARRKQQIGLGVRNVSMAVLLLGWRGVGKLGKATEVDGEVSRTREERVGFSSSF